MGIQTQKILPTIFAIGKLGPTAWTTVEDIDALTYTATGLDPSTDYEAQVKAKNDFGESDWSPSGFGYYRR